MYLTLRDPALEQDRDDDLHGGGRRGAAFAGRRVGSTVLLLGMVSFFTDVSSEMVTSVLPMYLTVVVGLSPLAFGLVDGVQQGFSAFVRLGAGVLGDRLQRYKGVAATGYGLSALSRVLLVVAPTGAGAGAITGIVALDRTGKGMRTAPRDTMIALAAPEGRTGTAFGVHRALDSAGAALGPLLALLVLLLTVDDYRAVFVCSTGLAVIGLAVLSLVRDPSRDRPRQPRTAYGPWTAPLRDAALRRICVAAGLLAVLTVSDAFLLLALQQRTDLNPGWFPLLFVGVAGSYAVLALPAGRLTDRFGAVPVLIAGHVVLVAAYCALLPAALPIAATVVVVVLLGAYYAATDGVLMALVARRLPERSSGTSMGAVQTAVAAGRLVSSVGFGVLWWGTSATVALTCYGTGLLVALPVAARLLRSQGTQVQT